MAVVYATLRYPCDLFSCLGAQIRLLNPEFYHLGSWNSGFNCPIRIRTCGIKLVCLHVFHFWLDSHNTYGISALVIGSRRIIYARKNVFSEWDFSLVFRRVQIKRPWQKNNTRRICYWIGRSWCVFWIVHHCPPTKPTKAEIFIIQRKYEKMKHRWGFLAM